jgi:hypothetical protein
MSKLHETPLDKDTKGWQWEDGPIFLGDDARKWAIEYGKALLRLAALKKMSKMQHEQHWRLKQIEALKRAASDAEAKI